MILEKHYLKSALTNFRRNKWYTLLMVLSLAVGMFCFVLASIFIDYEFSRNTNHEDAEKIHRVMVKIGQTDKRTYLPLSFAEQIAQVNPAVEAVSLLDFAGEVYISADKEAYVLEDDSFFANPGFLEVFTFPFKYGNKASALEGIGSVIISDRLAELLFPGKNPVGESLMVHEQGVFQITGVLAPVSDRSIINPGLLFSHEYLRQLQPRKRFTDVNLTHIKLKEPMEIAQLQAELYDDFQQYFGDERIGGIHTEKLTDEYWGTSHYDYGAQFMSLMGPDKQMIRTVGYVSFGVLICAFIGYLSLALSISIRRTKEIGVRKVNGARTSDIRKQLLAESMCYALLSLVVTVVILELSSDYFSGLFQVPIGLALDKASTLLPLLVFALLTGLLSGVYPALVVSKLKPTAILSGLSTSLNSNFSLKRVLLISQLAVTMILVFCVLVLRLQVGEMSSFDIGYNKDGVVTFNVGDAGIKKNYASILDELSNLSGVEAITGGPFPINFNGFRPLRIQLQDSLIKDNVAKVNVQQNFFDVMGISLLAGELFNAASDLPINETCIVNEAFAKRFGLDAVGMSIEYDGQFRTIQGVVENYADWGVTNPTPNPHVYLPVTKPDFHNLLIRFDEDQVSAGVARMTEIWRKYETVKEPNITVLSVKQESATGRLSKMSLLFGFLATMVLILSMMNLFGIATMYVSSKQKNLSIRKVLGAETMELFRRLSMPFVSAVFIGLLVALPIAYSLMQAYLKRFAVHIELTALPGVLVTMAMVTLLFVVIGYQMLKSSRANPLESLKVE